MDTEASKEQTVLMDNGSLRAESTLSLRRIAGLLEAIIGQSVVPVSLLHSSKVAPDELEGRPAWTWRRFLKQRIEQGVRRFRVIPLFFGPSSALVDYLPKVTGEIAATMGPVELIVSRTLVDADNLEDLAVARILNDLLIHTLDTNRVKTIDGVIMVDHGSPLRAVAECRNLVAKQLKELSANRVGMVMPSSMERREGKEYDFNEPLLETALTHARSAGWKQVVLSYLFLSPGRHAGPEGDIDQILADSSFVRSGGVVFKTPLVGESEALSELLALRYRQSLDGKCLFAASSWK